MTNSSAAASIRGFPCLFCRSDTGASKAKEHIIPASLGNEEHILPEGLVCDKCNNYFGRKVEQPVLESTYFHTMRARQALTSRAGNPLLWDGIAMTGGSQFRASLSVLEESIYFEPIALDGNTPVETAIERAQARQTGGRLWLPNGGEEPEARLLSRFFAKIGLEVLAHRLLGSSDFSTILYDAQLDPVRMWARYGSGTVQWPLHRRRLYGEDHRFNDETQPDGHQLLHEFDLLVTETNEWYAIVCLFGEEFAINLGGPEIEGYEIWLKLHDQASPLYSGKNAPLKPI